MLQFAERDMGASEPWQIIDKIEYSYKDPAGKSELRCLENQISRSIGYTQYLP